MLRPDDDQRPALSPRGTGPNEPDGAKARRREPPVALRVDQVRDPDERGHERCRGLAIDDLRRRALLDPSAHHHRHAVAERERLVLVVGDEDRRGAGGAEDLADVATKLCPQGGVEVRERLVEQHDVRPRRERPSERHPLLHAARQLIRHVGSGVDEVDQLEQLANPDLAVGVVAQPIPDVVADRQVREEREVLEHHPDPPSLGRHGSSRAGHAAAADRDRSGVGRFEAGDQTEHRRFAAARRAEHGQHLRGHDVEVEAIHRPQRAVVAGQVTDPHGGRRHHGAGTHRAPSSFRRRTATVAAESTSSTAAGPAARV